MMMMMTTIKVAPRPPRTPPSPPYDFPLYNTPLPSAPTMSDNKIEQTPTSREKTAFAEKVKFAGNLNKLFSKAENISGFPNKPDEITIPHAQVICKELNEGKLPKQLRFFSGGNNGINELRIHATTRLKD